MNTKLLLLRATVAILSMAGIQASAGEKAKIERAAAEKIALARVPGGAIKEGELETEHGKLVWSFDVASKTSAELVEVQVDANTGEVLAVETSADDKKEGEDEDKDNK